MITFLEGAQSQVHGADGEEREGVDLDHEGHEGEVEEDAAEAEKEVAVEHEDALVFPGVVALLVDGVEEVFEEGAEDGDEQDGVLKGSEY